MMEEDGIALFLSEVPFFDYAFTALESPVRESNTEMYAQTDPIRPCPVTRQLVFYPAMHHPLTRGPFDTVNHDLKGLQTCIEVLQLDATTEAEEMGFALCDENPMQTPPIGISGAYDLAYTAHDIETCSNADDCFVFKPEPSLYDAGAAFGMADQELTLPFHATTDEATQPQFPSIGHPLEPYYERELRRVIPGWQQENYMKPLFVEEVSLHIQSLWSGSPSGAITPLQLGYHSRAPSWAFEAHLSSPLLTETRYENKNEAVFTHPVG